VSEFCRKSCENCLTITPSLPPNESSPSLPPNDRSPSLPPNDLYIPPEDASWSLLAWGWNNGGKDDVTNTLIVDVDYETSVNKINQLRTNEQIVLCYFSAGTLEKWRTDYKNADTTTKEQWDSLIVKKMGDWNEWWLDFTGTNLSVLKELMSARLQKMKDIGCHGVEPDNVDCYDNSRCRNGRDKSTLKEDQIIYNKWLADEAHKRGMFIALKNAVGIIPDLVNHFDCAMNESCYRYNECDTYEPFIKKKKLVMNVEYATQNSGWCSARGSSELMSKWCDGKNNVCKKDTWVNCW